jgi:hypothetical protein
MAESAMTIGKALAHLKSDGQKKVEGLSQPDREYLESLRQRIDTYRHNMNVHHILDAVPQYTCDLQQAYISDHEDTLLVLFFAIQQQDTCPRITNHLNSCYSCFERFSQVLRDYYYQKEEMNSNKGL